MIRCDVRQGIIWGGVREAYLDCFRDSRMVLTSIIRPNTKNDGVIVRTYLDLEGMTTAEMRDLWAELKKPYISPPVIMERIRADVLECLHSDGRVDLVAVCLDSAPHMEDKKRL